MNTLRLSAILALVLALALVSSCADEDTLAPTGAVASTDGQAKSGPTPIHFQVYNTIEIVPPPPPPYLNAIFEGYGKAHPFGPFTMYSTSQIDVTVYPAHQLAEIEFTFRNGDLLLASTEGESIEDPPGSTIFWGAIEFTGGTGRFAGATGSGTYEGTADIATGFGQFTIDGTLEGFGGD